MYVHDMCLYIPILSTAKITNSNKDTINISKYTKESNKKKNKCNKFAKKKNRQKTLRKIKNPKTIFESLKMSY